MVISDFTEMINNTKSDIDDEMENIGTELIQDDLVALRQMCVAFETFPNRSSGLKFQKAEETKLDLIMWERTLAINFREFANKFDRVNELQGDVAASQILNELRPARQDKLTYILLGDMSKPSHIHDVCGVLLFYDRKNILICQKDDGQ